jgi:hypothetical protein
LMCRIECPSRSRRMTSRFSVIVRLLGILPSETD